MNCSQSPVGVHDEGVAAVLSAELHHQSELVHPAGGLEQRHQLVFVHVSGNLPHKHLAAPRRWRALPACSRVTVWVKLQAGADGLPDLLPSCTHSTLPTTICHLLVSARTLYKSHSRLHSYTTPLTGVSCNQETYCLGY